MPQLQKRTSELQASDVEQLIADGAVEDEQLEFKRELSTREGRPDRWHATQDQVGERARNELLEEVVGFANAYGGDVVVGIGEAGTPPRATSKHPLPACENLAHRLELAARDCIEPPLPRLEVVGLPITPGGHGYVVLRTARSLIGPHRLRPTLQCYRRSGARTEAMTMRQIQDHTLSTANSMSRIETRYGELRARFARSMGSTLPRGVHGRLGLRVSAVPVQTEVLVDRVHGVDEVRPSVSDWLLHRSSGAPLRLNYVAHGASWRLVMRGTESRTTTPVGGTSNVLLGCDGALTYEMFLDCKPEQPGPGFVVYPEWLMSMYANAIASADRFRTHTGYMGVDYGVEVEVAVLGQDMRVSRLGGGYSLVEEHIGAPGVVFPRYAIGPNQSLIDAFRPFYVDFWANVGVDGEADALTDLTRD